VNRDGRDKPGHDGDWLVQEFQKSKIAETSDWQAQSRFSESFYVSEMHSAAESLRIISRNIQISLNKFRAHSESLTSRSLFE
jgi:hypothetical protein